MWPIVLEMRRDGSTVNKKVKMPLPVPVPMRASSIGTADEMCDSLSSQLPKITRNTQHLIPFP